QAQPQRARIQARAIAGDHSAGLEPLDRAQAGRGAEVHPGGQFGVGRAAFPLEQGQQAQVGAVELDGIGHSLQCIICSTQQHCARKAGGCNFATRLRGNRHRLGPSARTGVQAMASPRRVESERLQTDKGYVPVYTTAIVEQPWDDYSADDHATWGTLYERQRKLLVGRARDEFLQAQDAMGMDARAIPRFDQLNEVLGAATGWTLVGVEGLLPELDFFEHLANRRFPVTWWIRRPDQIDYIAEPDLFHDLFGHVPLLMNPL